jgi:hypothetical protein
MLDVAGTSLYSMSKHAKSQGNEEGARLAMVMSIILLSVMTATALSATANVVFPSLAWLTQIVDHVLVFVRIAIVVAYGFVVHQISTLSEMHDNRIEELEAELNAKTEELNAVTINLNGQLNAKTNELNALTIKVNGQLNALQQRLNAKDQEVNALTIKVHAQTNARTDELDTDKIVQLDAEMSYEVRIRSLLESEPGLTGGEISRRLGCSIPTACNWKKRIEKEDRAV